MELLSFVILMLLMVVNADEFVEGPPVESLDDVLVYPVDPPMNIRKRSALTRAPNEDLTKFIEDKLVQHTRALEHLLTMAQKNEELTNQLIESLSNHVAEPTMPEKIEVHHVASPGSAKDQDDHPIVKLGKNIPKYGTLVKNMLWKQVRDVPDPMPVVEQAPKLPQPYNPLLKSRRSFDGQAVSVPVVQTTNEISPWCPVAMLCRRTMNPTCGYDDNFGYGKFDDVCHMLQVNCYWKYNFAVIANCRPIFVHEKH